MKRGEIYYIDRRDTVGSEIQKACPAIIVSADVLNAASATVTVVYLTTQPKKEQATHVEIHSTGRQSTALCENVDCVSTMLVGSYCGTCTEGEMQRIDDALRAALGLRSEVAQAPTVGTESQLELVRVAAERDVYKKLYDQLLERFA
jgi:mRNA interferase MazF